MNALDVTKFPLTKRNDPQTYAPNRELRIRGSHGRFPRLTTKKKRTQCR